MRQQPLHLSIAPGKSLPIYRQIERQIADSIALGKLLPGDRLAPYQQVAERLAISPLAVKKAYQSLVSDGLCRVDEHSALRVSRVAATDAAPKAPRVMPGTLGERAEMARELELARDVQCRLLPPRRVEGERFLVAARYLPARFVGGDFYDVIRHPDGSVGVVVGDVAGSGLGASLIMASVKAVLPFVAADRTVEGTLQELNRRLHAELSPREFVALAYARFDPAGGSVRVANAGLPDPCLLRRGQAPMELRVSGPRLPLGVWPRLGYEALEIELRPGDRLFFYSDGIPEERRRDGEPLGYDLFSELLQRCHAAYSVEPAERWLDEVLHQVRESVRRPSPHPPDSSAPETQSDDWTVLVIESRLRRRGAHADPPHAQ